VAFLPKNRILVASTHAGELAGVAIPNFMARASAPVLAVFNLLPTPMMGIQQVKHIPAAMFDLELGRDVVPIDMHLHYRLDAHTPEVAVPFFSSPGDQIVALETTNHLRTPDSRGQGLILPLRHILLIPIAKLLYHVGTTENGRTCFVHWNDWGSTGIYRFPAPWPSLCRNAVSGSRFIPRPQSRDVIGVCEFSHAQARATQFQASAPRSVQYVQREVALPTGISGSVTAAISEDVIVIHEVSIVAPSICPLIYIQLIYVLRFCHPRGRRGSIFSSSRVSSANAKQDACRVCHLVDNHLAVPAALVDLPKQEMEPKTDTAVDCQISTGFYAEHYEISENRSPVSVMVFTVDA